MSSAEVVGRMEAEEEVALMVEAEEDLMEEVVLMEEDQKVVADLDRREEEGLEVVTQCKQSDMQHSHHFQDH